MTIFSVMIGLLGIGFGGLIYLMVAFHQPLWLDELHTDWATSADWADVGQRSSNGNQTSLYFWIVWCQRALVTAICGAGINSVSNSALLVLTLRCSSIMAGVLILLIAAVITRQAQHHIAGAMVVVILIGLDSSFLFYATEARPYALMQLVGLIQVIFFGRWIEWLTRETWSTLEKKEGFDSSTRWQRATWLWHPAIGWGVTSSLMLLIHLTSIWLLISEFVFLLLMVGFGLNASWFSRLTSKPHWLPSCFGLILVSITIAFVVFDRIELIERRGNWESVSSVQALWDSVRWNGLAYWVFPFLLALPFSLLVTAVGHKSGVRGADDQSNHRAWRILGRGSKFGSIADMVFLLLWGLVPIVGVILADYFQVAPLALKRYTWIGAIALPIFAGRCVNMVPGIKWQVVIGTLIVAGSLLIQGSWITALVSNQIVLRNENWEVVMLEIDHDSRRKDWPVLLYSNLIEDQQVNVKLSSQFQEFLKFPLHRLESIEGIQRQIFVGATTLPQPLPQEAWAAVRRSKGAWVVVRGLPELRDQILDDLEREGAEMVAHIDAFDFSGSDNDRSISLQFDIAKFSNWPNHDVHLIRVTVLFAVAAKLEYAKFALLEKRPFEVETSLKTRKKYCTYTEE